MQRSNSTVQVVTVALANSEVTQQLTQTWCSEGGVCFIESGLHVTFGVKCNVEILTVLAGAVSVCFNKKIKWLVDAVHCTTV